MDVGGDGGCAYVQRWGQELSVVRVFALPGCSCTVDDEGGLSHSISEFKKQSQSGVRSIFCGVCIDHDITRPPARHVHVSAVGARRPTRAATHHHRASPAIVFVWLSFAFRAVLFAPPRLHSTPLLPLGANDTSDLGTREQLRERLLHMPTGRYLSAN